MLHAQLLALQRCDIQMECSPANEAQISDSSGGTYKLATGAAAACCQQLCLPPHAGHISKMTKPKPIPLKEDVVYPSTSSSPSYDSAGKMQKCQRFVGTHLCVQMLERWAAGGLEGNGAGDDDSQSGKTCETWANNYTNMSTRAPTCELPPLLDDRPATIIVVYLVLAFSANAEPESRKSATCRRSGLTHAGPIKTLAIGASKLLKLDMQSTGGYCIYSIISCRQRVNRKSLHIRCYLCCCCFAVLTLWPRAACCLLPAKSDRTGDNHNFS